MEKIKYKAYSFKLNKDTLELLFKVKEIFGGSWNLFFYNIIREHINTRKESYRHLFKPTYSFYRKDCCEICGKKEEFKKGGYLAVHHIDNDLTNNKENNLQTLCGSCHAKSH